MDDKNEYSESIFLDPTKYFHGINDDLLHFIWWKAACVWSYKNIIAVNQMQVIKQKSVQALAVEQKRF